MREPPKGYRFDAFADVRMGQSIFQMEPEDWLVPDDHVDELSAEEALWLGHPVAHIVQFYERQRLARIEAQQRRLR